MILGVGSTPFCTSFRLIFWVSGSNMGVGRRGGPCTASMVEAVAQQLRTEKDRTVGREWDS